MVKMKKRSKDRRLSKPVFQDELACGAGAEDPTPVTPGVKGTKQPKKKTHVVMVISDTQFPFEHKDTFEFLEAVKAKYRPTDYVHIGDELDYHSVSNYKPNPDGWSPGEEFKQGLERMKRLYKLIGRRCKVCISNHGERPYRRAYDAGIPNGWLKSYQELLEAPEGWEWADTHEIDGVLYEHGNGMTGEYAHKYAAAKNMQSTVMGHLHANAGVEWIANRRHLVFGFAVGCLQDKDSYSAAYGKYYKRKPIVSCGIVDHGSPILVPMWLNENGRWTGEL